MITKAQALALKVGDVVQHVSRRDHRGNPVQCKVRGPCRSFRNNPDKWEVPVLHPLTNCYRIGNHNATDWEIA